MDSFKNFFRAVFIYSSVLITPFQDQFHLINLIFMMTYAAEIAFLSCCYGDFNYSTIVKIAIWGFWFGMKAYFVRSVMTKQFLQKVEADKTKDTLI